MSEEITASHILCSTEVASNKEALKSIKKIQARLAKGEAFEELAREVSDCPSGSQGGDLGSFGRGRMVDEFDKAAFDLEVGETSPVVETEFGYHLILRTL